MRQGVASVAVVIREIGEGRERKGREEGRYEKGMKTDKKVMK